MDDCLGSHPSIMHEIVLFASPEAAEDPVLFGTPILALFAPRLRLQIGWLVHSSRFIRRKSRLLGDFVTKLVSFLKKVNFGRFLMEKTEF